MCTLLRIRTHKSNQKVGPFRGTFRPISISKSCFWNLQGRTGKLPKTGFPLHYCISLHLSAVSVHILISWYPTPFITVKVYQFTSWYRTLYQFTSWHPDIQPQVEGIGLREPVTLTLTDLETKFSQTTITAAIQCAGNRRADMAQVGLYMDNVCEYNIIMFEQPNVNLILCFNYRRCN